MDPILMNPTIDRLAISLAKAGAAATAAIIFQTSQDAELVAAWQQTDGEPGNPIADLLAAEMERREIAF